MHGGLWRPKKLCSLSSSTASTFYPQDTLYMFWETVCSFCVHSCFFFSTKLSFHGVYVASKLTAFCKYDIKSKYFAGPYFVIIADQINKTVNCLYVLLNFSWHVYQLLLNINIMPSFYLLFIFNNFGTKSYITF